MISVEEVVKYYGPQLAIDCASFSVKEGETVGLLGPNGAGKSTLIRIIAGLVPATGGQVRIDGISIRERPLEVKRRIGYLPEMCPLYLDLPVETYLSFVSAIKGVPRKQRIEQIKGVVARCGLEDVLNRLIGRLSKGYRQRLGLAQALLGNPAVIILDEPTIGLDPHQILVFRRLIQELKGTCTILLSTHILPEASMICDRLIIINRGRIVARNQVDLSGQAENKTEFVVCLEGPREEVHKELSGLQGVSQVTSVTTTGDPGYGRKYRLVRDSDTDPRQDLVRLAVANNWQLLELYPARLDLEEVYMKAIMGEQTG